MKMSNLHRTSKEGEEDDEDSDSEDEEEEEEKKPELNFASIKHLGCVNRIRVCHFAIHYAPTYQHFKCYFNFQYGKISLASLVRAEIWH